PFCHSHHTEIITQQTVHLSRIEALFVPPPVELLSAARAYCNLHSEILTAWNSAEDASSGLQHPPNLLQTRLGHRGCQVFEHLGHDYDIEERIRERQFLNVTSSGLVPQMQRLPQLSDAPFIWIQ